MGEAGPAREIPRTEKEKQSMNDLLVTGGVAVLGTAVGAAIGSNFGGESWKLAGGFAGLVAGGLFGALVVLQFSN